MHASSTANSLPIPLVAPVISAFIFKILLKIRPWGTVPLWPARNEAPSEVCFANRPKVAVCGSWELLRPLTRFFAKLRFAVNNYNYFTGKNFHGIHCILYRIISFSHTSKQPHRKYNSSAGLFSCKFILLFPLILPTGSQTNR